MAKSRNVFEIFIIQGCKFSDFSLISDFFTSTYLKIIFKISSLDHISHYFIIESGFQKRFCFISDFFI